MEYLQLEPKLMKVQEISKKFKRYIKTTKKIDMIRRSKGYAQIKREK